LEPAWLIENKLLINAGDHSPLSYESLHKTPQDQILFRPDAYNKIVHQDPRLVTSPELSHLILLFHEREHGVRFKFSPTNAPEVLQPSLLELFEKLAKAGLGAVIDVVGPFSVYDGYLGRFDRNRASDTPKKNGRVLYLFPQFEPEVRAEAAEPFKYRNPFLVFRTEIMRKVDDVKICNVQGHVLEEETAEYKRLLDELTLGARNLATIDTRIKKILPSLSTEQTEDLHYAVCMYFLDALSRGQVLDLDGIDQVAASLDRPIVINPEIADMLCLLYDHIGIYTLGMCHAIDRTTGYVTRQIYSSPTTDQEFRLEHIRKVEAKGISYTSLLDLWSTTDTTVVQPEMTEYLVHKIQKNVAALQITPYLVGQMNQLSQILYLMNGENAGLDRISVEARVLITHLLEQATGRRLEALRSRFPWNIRHRLAELEPGLQSPSSKELS
jgi:hypothetical protein